MILVVCLDDCLGMAFFGRRQSRDRVLIADLCAEAGTAPIHMDIRSAILFSETGADIRPDESFAEKAEAGEYCFLEFISPALLEAKAEKLIIYRWNRRYQSDLKFDIDLSRWLLQSSLDFPGSSHDTITKEVYIREQ